MVGAQEIQGCPLATTHDVPRALPALLPSPPPPSPTSPTLSRAGRWRPKRSTTPGSIASLAASLATLLVECSTSTRSQRMC